MSTFDPIWIFPLIFFLTFSRNTYVRAYSVCDWPLYSFPIVSVVVVCEYCIDRVEYVKCLE